MSAEPNRAKDLSYTTLSQSFATQGLFASKTWRYSPVAFPLDAQQLAEIESIGQACYDFCRAQETLYLRSAMGKHILRNRALKAPWVAEYLDRGKPAALIEYARSKALRGSMPMVLRPDLLITQQGFALTEIDAVPGGIGLTAFLNRLYTRVHADDLIGAGEQDMVEAFYRGLCRHAGSVLAPNMVILVSDEAATYRPEMEWLAQELRLRGRRVSVHHPNEMVPLGDSIGVRVNGELQPVDLMYRFWELFDLKHVPIAEYLLQAGRMSALSLTPPMRPFQEEKLNLALFHHPMLRDFWQETLSRRSYQTLKRVIPPTWVIDPVELPPNAVLNAPYVGGRPISAWSELIKASKKERNLIIKISGFHERAWGARSVILGSDCSKAAWQAAVQQAIHMADTSLHILQTYKKPKRLQHPVYHTDGSLYQMEGRVRLCPYYFVDEATQSTQLHGVLATVCPADKKIIHGMRDAALLPCVRWHCGEMGNTQSMRH